MKNGLLVTAVLANLSMVSCDQPQNPPPPQAANTKQAGSQSAAPQNWNEWAQWVEAQHSTGDGQGHGPDVGSDEWAHALEHQLGISDGQGHGPDFKSAEWRSAVEFKLRNP